MSDGAGTQQIIEAAVRDRDAHLHLTHRLHTAAAHAQECAARVTELRRVLDDETADVAALESFSWARIRAGLKGTRDADLSKEAAEQEAARYAVAEAEARARAADEEVAHLEWQIAQMGDVVGAYARALEERQRYLESEGGPQGARLVEIAERRGALLAEDREAEEACSAGHTAYGLLQEAHRLLGSARSWASWDTFGGGGMVSDMMKYDKLQQVSRTMERADVALQRFSRELADLGAGGVEVVQLDDLTRVFDVFFDNVFTDWSVRSRIVDGEQRVADTMAAVSGVLRDLMARRGVIGDELRSLDAERERLLVAR